MFLSVGEYLFKAKFRLVSSLLHSMRLSAARVGILPGGSASQLIRGRRAFIPVGSPVFNVQHHSLSGTYSFKGVLPPILGL